MSESKFRATEISDPRFEAEGLRWVTVKSGALRQRADLTLFVPGQAQPRNLFPSSFCCTAFMGVTGPGR